jgi:hypothetical protein
LIFLIVLVGLLVLLLELIVAARSRTIAALQQRQFATIACKGKPSLICPQRLCALLPGKRGWK